jgi:hypothetical protein
LWLCAVSGEGKTEGRKRIFEQKAAERQSRNQIVLVVVLDGVD